MRIKITENHINFMFPRDSDYPVGADTIFQWVHYAITNSVESDLKSLTIITPPGTTNADFVDLNDSENSDDPWLNVAVSDKDGYCWTQLFDSRVRISVPKPRPFKRQKSYSFPCRGLVLELGTMIQLSAVEWPVPAGQGLVFIGYSTALIPIKETDDGMILWHLEVANHDHQLKISELDAIRGKWLETQDMEYLQSRKSLLGWCGHAKVLLGTDQLKPAVAWSVAKAKPTSLHLSGINLQTLAQSAAPIQIGGSATVSFDRISNIIRFNHPDNYIVCLDRALREPIILYDVKAKRAWLVSLLSAFHHMLLAYCDYIGKHSLENVRPPPKNVASASSQRGHASIDTLREASSTIIRRMGDHTLDVSQIIMKFSSAMSQTSLHKPRGSEIFGYEFMDIVIEPSTAPLKRIRVEKDGLAWASLLNEVNCLFCSDLGEAIVGSRASDISSPCNSLPLGNDFLAASMQVLDGISSRHGGSTTDGLYRASRTHFWQLSASAFQECQHNGRNEDNCWCRPEFLHELQTSQSTSGINSQCLSKYHDAALVFGTSSTRARTSRLTTKLRSMYQSYSDLAEANPREATAQRSPRVDNSRSTVFSE